MFDDERIKRYNEHLNKIPFDKIKFEAEKQAKLNEKQFSDLKEALAKDKCSYCGNLLTHFSIKKPCLHWLLWRAKGLKKKHFYLLLEDKGYHKTDAYLRWVANCENPIKNINNLDEEKSSNKFIETTIRYKNLEWSFSCSHGDLIGHKDKFKGQHPHFHFQMKRDENVVINYNSFHIPFNDYDDFLFAIESGKIDRLKHKRIHGAGMQELFEYQDKDKLVSMMSYAEDATDAQFSLDTFIEADEGSTISGDDLADILEERKKTGVPLAKLVNKLKNVKIKTFISPGPGVPEIAHRKKNRGKH